MENENQIIENLKVIAEHLNKDWDGKFSECGCGAYLIGHPEKCRGCSASNLTYLEVCLNNSFNSKRGPEGLEAGDKLIVEFNNGQKYYAVYSNEDEFDVHKPDGNKYRKQWYKYSSMTIKSWTKI